MRRSSSSSSSSINSGRTTSICTAVSGPKACAVWSIAERSLRRRLIPTPRPTRARGTRRSRRARFRPFTACRATTSTTARCVAPCRARSIPTVTSVPFGGAIGRERHSGRALLVPTFGEELRRQSTRRPHTHRVSRAEASVVDYVRRPRRARHDRASSKRTTARGRRRMRSRRRRGRRSMSSCERIP